MQWKTIIYINITFLMDIYIYRYNDTSLHIYIFSQLQYDETLSVNKVSNKFSMLIRKNYIP